MKVERLTMLRDKLPRVRMPRVSVDWLGLLMAGSLVVGGMIVAWACLRPVDTPSYALPVASSAAGSAALPAPRSSAVRQMDSALAPAQEGAPDTSMTPSREVVTPVSPDSPGASTSYLPATPDTARRAARAQSCQDLIETVRPPYAPQTGWSIACVKQIPADVRKQTGWTVEEITGWTDFATHRINIINSGRVPQMRQSIAHEWAHAESASWGLQEAKFTAHWVKLLGYAPATAQEFWNEKRHYEDQAAERWAESRSRCAGYTYGQPVARLVPCSTVASMLEFIASSRR